MLLPIGCLPIIAHAPNWGDPQWPIHLASCQLAGWHGGYSGEVILPDRDGYMCMCACICCVSCVPGAVAKAVSTIELDFHLPKTKRKEAEYLTEDTA